MYRGTTPTLIYNVNSNLDLNGMLQIWVTLKNLCYEKTYEKKELIINDEEKKIEIKFLMIEILEILSIKKIEIKLLICLIEQEYISRLQMEEISSFSLY